MRKLSIRKETWYRAIWLILDNTLYLVNGFKCCALEGGDGKHFLHGVRWNHIWLYLAIENSRAFQTTEIGKEFTQKIAICGSPTKRRTRQMG